MVRCPVCESVQIGFLVSPRPTSCYYCGATWLQDGSEQTSVRGVPPHRHEGGARIPIESDGAGFDAATG
jgi:hypothetical protein